MGEFHIPTNQDNFAALSMWEYTRKRASTSYDDQELVDTITQGTSSYGNLSFSNFTNPISPRASQSGVRQGSFRGVRAALHRFNTRRIDLK